MTPKPGTESYLVIGGCGFLGRHIVEMLINRGETQVAVFDIVQRHFDTNVSFYVGDISDEDQISGALRKFNTSVVIHTASPIHGLSKEIYEKVNVIGTQTVIAASIQTGVRKLVFTSSAGVVYDGEENLVDVDERLDYPKVAMDAYNDTKARAEQAVLEANGKGGLLTCALRPAGIFGPGDRQALVGFAQVIKNNQTKFQLGNNTNLFDWTYVSNVAHAHLLAADRLGSSVSMESFDEPLQPIEATSLPSIRIPTSDSKPLGPNPNPTEDDKKLSQIYADASTALDVAKPVLRTKFDQFANPAPDPEDPEAEKPVESVSVAGQAFFITNCEPVYFWDFARAIWAEMGHVAPWTISLPKPIGIVLARLAEGWAKISGKEPGFTAYRVKFSTQARYYNNERARRVLGYEPIVSVHDGIKMAVAWYKETEAEKAAAIKA
ncbi:C-3 dehydrogenase [Phaffia rhodozyma]|uniref:C-3 dehydrogenase n=1 Tax=Phaffia rhodozyma TaxID=264483 RepID=A0A0F7SF06_PHARH|nr:C-3 dehydrogenase [Phaffia rhodozyma]